MQKTRDVRCNCQKMFCRFAVVCGCATRLSLLHFNNVRLQVCLVTTRKGLANCKTNTPPCCPSEKKSCSVPRSARCVVLMNPEA